MKKKIINLISKFKPSNNTEKALIRLLKADGEWVARTALRIPSATSRIRDLRTKEFGKLQIECVSARNLGKRSRSMKTTQQTYYRLVNNGHNINQVSKLQENSI